MEFTMDDLRAILEHILEELNSGNVKKHDWYGGLFQGVEIAHAEELEDYESSTYATVYGDMQQEEERYSLEHVLAIEAIRYPELHKLMHQIVIKITEYGEQGNFKQIWENEEVQAGGAFARELAMYNKDDIPLYCRYIKTNDLDHEVYQLDDMLAILTKWDYSLETMPILFYRQDNGQGGGIYGSNICKNITDTGDYLNAVIAYVKEEWEFDPNDKNNIRETVNWLEPIFSEVLALSEEQMLKFATEFVVQMSNDNTPTIETLLAAAKG